MSRKLKEAFNQKMDMGVSPKFDAHFFQKLEQEKSKGGFFARYTTWIISGCATLSVLFFAVNNYQVTPKHAFNHQEYVETVIDMQNSFDESVSSDYQTDMIDLTSEKSDEI